MSWRGGAAVTNNEHAARLREMAEGNCRWAIAYKYETDPISQIRLNSLHEDAAALLAGAEALEAVEAAKAALEAEAWKIGNGTPTMDGNSFYRILSGDQHAVATAYKAALARLEGK